MLGLMNILSACFHVDIMCSCTAQVEINLQLLAIFFPFFFLFFFLVCVWITHICDAQELNIYVFFEKVALEYLDVPFVQINVQFFHVMVKWTWTIWELSFYIFFAAVETEYLMPHLYRWKHIFVWCFCGELKKENWAFCISFWESYTRISECSIECFSFCMRQQQQLAYKFWNIYKPLH